MAQTDVLAANATATGVIVNAPARIKAIYFVGTATAGSLSFKNGGSGGTELLKIDTPADVTDCTSIFIPENGVRFPTNVHVTLTNVASVTVFYG